MYWYSKKKNTVKTYTYGYEFFSLCTYVEQVICLWNILQYIDVPNRHKSYMFGYHKYVVDSVTHPYAKLRKYHTALFFHRVWETISYKMFAFYYVSGGDNLYNILSNHWRCSKVWILLKPLILWMGYTINLLDLELSWDDVLSKR